MNLVACPRCGAQMDVSKIQAGTTFKCGGCGNMLQAPAAPVAKPAAPPAKPVAAPPKPAAAPAPAPSLMQKKPGVDRRRAGDAAPGAEPKGRAERIRHQRGEEGGAPKKNPLPLVLSGVALLVIVGGGAIYAMSGGKKDAAGEGEAKPGPEKAGPAPAPDKPKTFEDLPKSEQLALVESKVKEAARGPSTTKEVCEWLEGKGLKSDAQRVLEAGRKAFPGDAWILGRLGLADRSADIRAAASNDEFMFNIPEGTAELVYVQDLGERVKKDKNAGWLAPEEGKRFDDAVAALKTLLVSASDPVFQRTQKEYTNLRNNAAFAGREFSFKPYRPYVIFAESASEDRKALSDEIVAKTGVALQFIYRRWVRFMKEDLGLDPPLLEDAGDDRLRVFIFKSREAFDAWHAKNGVANPGPSVLAYYEHGRDRMIMMHLDGYDEHIIMHEATHQLIHWYARWFTQKDDDAIAAKEGKPTERVEWEDTRLRSRLFWFQEGIAEYFGGCRPVKDQPGEWTIGELLVGRMMGFQMLRSQNRLWHLEEFLFEDSGGIYSRAKAKGMTFEKDEFVILMYSQGWILCHYLLEGDNGKYRDRMRALMRYELSGCSGRQYFLKAFGLPEGNARDPKREAFLKELEADYLRHYETLQARMRAGK